MAIKYSAANSDYNKDKSFASLSGMEEARVTLSEAVAIDKDENSIVVCGWVEAPLNGVEKFGDKGFTFESQLCKFTLNKKDYSREYQGKKNEYKATPGQLAAISLVESVGYGKPFKAYFDLGIMESIANTIMTGKKPDGSELTAAEAGIYEANFMRIEALDELDKLKGIELPKAGSGSGYSRGGGGQKESEKLKDRLEFLNEAMKPESDLRRVYFAVNPSNDDDYFYPYLNRLLEKIFS